MGGAGAPDDLEKGYQTQVWLAASNDLGALISGRYFHQQQIARCHKSAEDIKLQDELLTGCARLAGVKLS
jgi:hypothetical protein